MYDEEIDINVWILRDRRLKMNKILKQHDNPNIR